MQIQIVSKNEAGYVLKLQIGNVVMSGSEFAVPDYFYQD